MALPYNSPGVTVSESLNPSVAPTLASPQIIALVGPARGLQSASERLILTGTTASTLKYTGVVIGSVVVTLANTGLVANPGSYVVAQSSDPDSSVTGDETYTITRFGRPSTSPTVAATGTGTLTGTYIYAVSYLNANGETGIGPASAGVVVAGAGYNLTAIPLGPTGTTGRNIYRQKTSTGGDGKFHLVATIANNTVATLTNETTSDATAQGDGITTFGTAQPANGIADGDTVIVAYNFTDDNYYTPTLLSDYDDIVDKYGAPFDSNGAINSALSFAARFLFLNGATELVAVAAVSSAQTDLDAALAKLENQTSVRIVVSTGGTQSNAASVAAHCQKMNAQGLYRIGVVGLDGSSTAITAATLRSSAQGFNAEYLREINSASFQMTNPVTGRALNVGGQYMAAAIAGMYAARDVQIPLTRKSVAGFDSINDVRTASDLALDSSAGLLVIENKGGVLRVRHDLTTAIGSVNTREASVVRAKYELASRLKDSLDGGVIGVVVPQAQAPLMVQGAVTGVLEQVLTEGVISGYQNVKARVLTDPTTIEVRFQYTPSYPINNVAVIFTINTATQTTDFQLTG